MATRITEKTIRALGIVYDFAKKQESRGRTWPLSGISARWFGERMWPDSPAKTLIYNCGPNGAACGMGLWLCAGSYLRKLEARGLVSSEIEQYHDGSYGYVSYWHLTKDGRAALKEEEAKGQGQAPKKGKRQAKGRRKAAKA